MSLNFQNRGGQRISGIICAVLLIASIVLMTVYSREGAEGALHLLQNRFHAIFAPIEMLGAGVGSAVDDAGVAISDATADGETLSVLKERNKELTELLTKTEEYRLEAERLAALLKLKETYSIEGVSGRVIGRSTDAWNQTITIDVGTTDGVENGLTVVGPSGVVGQVVSVSEGSATVRLLTDPKSGAAAMIQSSRVDGVVRGSLTGELYLENVDASAAVSVGDVVLTSGLGGSYTKGLLIGTVVRIEGNASDGTRSIIVAPNEQAAALEEIMVVFSAAGIQNSEEEAETSSSDVNTQEGSEASSNEAAASNTLESGN